MRILIDRREHDIEASPDRVFDEIERLGGSRGWPAANVLWRVRGGVDSLVGGVGMRPEPRDRPLTAGDALDFWRVEAVERPRLLRLRAEMRLPGEAWLEFAVDPSAAGARLIQTASFRPRGFGGYAYWYLLLPIHQPIFRKLVRAVARRAVARPTGEIAAGRDS